MAHGKMKVRFFVNDIEIKPPINWDDKNPKELIDNLINSNVEKLSTLENEILKNRIKGKDDDFIFNIQSSSRLPTSIELIFCEKCVTCKDINKNDGTCMNASKMNWVDKDCKDYRKD